jgi:hypothetical protein
MVYGITDTQMDGHVPTRTLKTKLVSPASRVNKVVSNENENENEDDDDDYDDDQY